MWPFNKLYFIYDMVTLLGRKFFSFIFKREAIAAPTPKHEEAHVVLNMETCQQLSVSLDNSTQSTSNLKRSLQSEQADPTKRPRTKIEEKKDKMHSEPPNYFVAFRVSDKQVLENVANVQERMINRPLKNSHLSSKIFKETFISPHKLHFTLQVMNLQTEEDVSKAIQNLESIFKQLKPQFANNPLNLWIKGIGHFKNSVIFAKIQKDEDIQRVSELASKVAKSFESLGYGGDSKSFKPHLTIAKMSKGRKLNKKKVRSFPPEIWEDDANTEFGVQKVEGLQLLMMETDPETNYYKAVADFRFE